MRRLLAILAVALVAPASASALTHRQIADQHAAAHCAQLNCWSWNLDRVQNWMGGEQYFYSMWWTGYGFTCHYTTDPDVFVSDTLPITEHNWGGGNSTCG